MKRKLKKAKGHLEKTKKPEELGIFSDAFENSVNRSQTTKDY
ncbi:hypothetical protein FFONT_0002 [Fervidicoccus fontis Kam940]|uniref:Uncharacterized protein n=1 Tax=Fervidicoccus fontis (strain DSM 19380 / JCM 18336 / VKM B-2539 / Kam940) TaxID=1163730 RepID=H9ZZ42_FERFK|nr:hypothetical protein FFONT_0002 [Fervidicoccus fontis Kam940]